MATSSSSSSSDEDISLFQSVAVTADDIAESARREAAVPGRRKSNSTAGTPGQPDCQTAGRRSKSNAAAECQTRNGEELDMTSLKIAAALDALLAKRLEINSTPASAETSSSPVTVPAAAGAVGASAAERSPADASAPSTAADHSIAVGNAELDITGIRLFKHVRPGAACVISNTEYGDLEELDLNKPHLDPASRQHVRLRDLIPRYRLAAGSSSSKHQHEQMLAALAVDGESLLQAAAAAPGTAWQQHHQQQQQQQQRSTKQQKSAAAAGGDTLVAWRYLKKRKTEGLVMNAKEFVPHDVRMTKLLRLPLPE